MSEKLVNHTSGQFVFEVCDLCGVVIADIDLHGVWHEMAEFRASPQSPVTAAAKAADSLAKARAAKAAKKAAVVVDEWGDPLPPMSDEPLPDNLPPIPEPQELSEAEEVVHPNLDPNVKEWDPDGPVAAKSAVVDEFDPGPVPVDV